VAVPQAAQTADVFLPTKGVPQGHFAYSQSNI